MTLKNDKSKRKLIPPLLPSFKDKSPKRKAHLSPSFKTKNSKEKVHDVSHSPSKMTSNKNRTPTTPLPNKPSRKVMRSPNTASNTNILKVYTCSLREGIAIAFVTKAHNMKEAGFIYPIQDKIRNDHDFKSSINVDMILKRRSIDNEDINEFMPSSVKSCVYPFYQFVRLFDNEDDNNYQNVDEWGKQLASAFTDVAEEEYEYKAKFKYHSNITNVNEETKSYQYPNEFLIDDDVLEVISKIYPEYKENEEYINSIAESFFKDDKHAHFKIKNYDN